MKNLVLINEERRIRGLIGKASLFTEAGDFEGQSDWAKYICIVVAGYMENVVKELYADYSSKQVSGPVASFVISVLQQVRNPKPDKMLEFSGKFNPLWKVDLETFLNENGRKEAIESVMNNRHNIAHGKSKSIQLTVGAISNYFERCVEVANFIEGQCRK